MEVFDSPSHVRWQCKYHVVFIPKYRRKLLYRKLRASIGRILPVCSAPKGPSDTCLAPLWGASQSHALWAWLITNRRCRQFSRFGDRPN